MALNEKKLLKLIAIQRSIMELRNNSFYGLLCLSKITLKNVVIITLGLEWKNEQWASFLPKSKPDYIIHFSVRLMPNISSVPRYGHKVYLTKLVPHPTNLQCSEVIKQIPI